VGNPIKYTSRTFQTIMADINSDPELVDKPEWFKRLVAGVGDMVSMINNAAANNAFLGTAFTRKAVVELCAMIGYEIPAAKASSGIVLFYFGHDAPFPISIARQDLVATTRGTVAVSARRFEARDGLTFGTEASVTNLSTDPISSDTIYAPRSFLTGEKVRLSSSGAMPTGTSTVSDYYVIRVDASHIKLAATVAGAYSGTAIPVSGGSGNLTITLLSGRATVYQQESRPASTIGQSDGSSPWQEFDLPDGEVLRDTLSVTINGTPYLRVDTFALSRPNDEHYQHIYRSDGTSYIRFGSGEYGKVPPNFSVMASYAFGGGSASNVSVLNSVSLYAGTSEHVVGCSNATAMEGGADPQSSETARRIAPGTLRSRDRFITASDGEFLSVSYGGVSQTKVIPNAYGVLSCRVVCVADGGGNPAAGYRAELQQYLIDRTIMESIDVRVTEATFTPRSVNSSAKVKAGYVWADVLPYFRIAWKLFLSECGREIVNDYYSNGIQSAVLLCNEIFSEAFDGADYVQVERLIVALEEYEPRTFGDTIQESDALSYVQGGVLGIDYMTVSAPAFPIVHAEDEISSVGALTLSEIP